jgi:hypothetical protein
MSYPKKDEWAEARQVSKESAKDIAEWCGGVLVEEIDPFDPSIKTPGVNVPTLRGPKRASQGDYVILDVYDFFEVVNEYTYNTEMNS